MMTLHVIGTGSSGNCYVLRAETGQTLLLDAGVPIRQIVKGAGGLQGLQGCLVTHEHLDHAKAIKELANRGIDVYASKGTFDAVKGVDTPLNRFKVVGSKTAITIGEFTILPFDTQHDAKEPLGFIIRHDPTGENTLYATDTYYIKYTFPGIHYWVVECNFIDDIVQRQHENGTISETLRGRLTKSHMNLRRLKSTLQANDLSRTRKIVLVHLSDGRSDEVRMVEEIHKTTGVETVAATNGDVIQLAQTPF